MNSPKWCRCVIKQRLLEIENLCKQSRDVKSRSRKMRDLNEKTKAFSEIYAVVKYSFVPSKFIEKAEQWPQRFDAGRLNGKWHYGCKFNLRLIMEYCL